MLFVCTQLNANEYKESKECSMLFVCSLCYLRSYLFDLFVVIRY